MTTSELKQAITNWEEEDSISSPTPAVHVGNGLHPSSPPPLLSFQLLICEKRALSSDPLMWFHSILVFILTLAPSLYRVRPSSERQALFAIQSANLDSGRLGRGADNDQMPRAGPVPCVSSTHHVTGYRRRPETKCSTQCPAELRSRPWYSQCLPWLGLCELCPSLFCPPWLNQSPIA